MGEKVKKIPSFASDFFRQREGVVIRSFDIVNGCPLRAIITEMAWFTN